MCTEANLIPKEIKNISDLLAAYRGLYARLADQLGVDASYISRIAAGSRSNPLIQKALLQELQILHEQTMRLLQQSPVDEAFKAYNRTDSFQANS